ncbi:MAG: hypothetical protein HC802_18950 [Caldilineaceae bacterium]|nr:hypothetical protein [Caldilineaceae bacterium]
MGVSFPVGWRAMGGAFTRPRPTPHVPHWTWTRWRSSILVAALAIAALLLSACSVEQFLLPTSTPSAVQDSQPQRTSDPLVPTPVPGSEAEQNEDEPELSEAGAVKLADFTPAALAEPYSTRWRVGVGVPDGKSPLIYAWPDSYPGWYLNWSVGHLATGNSGSPVDVAPDLVVPPDDEAGMAFAPMVRTPRGKLTPDADLLAATVAQLPGRTWLIGNEPDVRWQDNATPEEYARAYHLAYTTIKEADPTAQVAIAGLSQITPLRLEYLDRVWDFYREEYGEEMPVDVWNMHAFVLQEKADDWGVDIPPGMPEVTHGMQWQIEEHDDLELVAFQVELMRRWMREHGQQQKPLWITEYGILMPESYGFYPGVVTTFMLDSFDLFEKLRDPELGFAEDEDRLVQRWVWFSAGYDLYPTGDLFTRDGAPKQLMLALAAYLDTRDP